METLLIIIGILGWLITAGMTFVAWRFYRKAAIYDEVLTYIADDVQTNLRQFVKISKSNVMMADTEVQTAHRNMVVMGKRLEEILYRMETATGIRLRPPDPKPRPKVVF